MRIKPIRNALIATTGISLAMIAGVGAWALFGGKSTIPEVRIPVAGQPSSTSAVTNAAKGSKSFDGLWNVTLQDPRNEMPAQIASPTVVQPATIGFGILLVGTVIEPTKTLALFRDDRGYFDLKGVGQPLELMPAGAQVASIEPGVATLQYEGREVKLSLSAGTTPASLSPGASGVMNGAQPTEESPENPVEPVSEPMGMMPLTPGDAAATSEDDIFAPLPDHMNPYKLAPDGGSSSSMETRP